jgi:Sulfotransferase family
MEEQPRSKVIYVMGAGRSGSTILGVALGNCEGVFFAGELDKWLVRRGASHLTDDERTRFWSGVREEVDAADLFGGEAHRCLERSSALFRIGEWGARRRVRARYRRVSEDLYKAVARAAGTTHLVDTSHYPLRARELQALEGVDLYLLFLVRHPQSVVASLDRRDVAERRLGMLTANAYLWLTHLLCVLVFLRHPRGRRLFVRHEDFVADPEGVLRQILDMTGSASTVPDLRELRTGIPLHGNRLVNSELIGLQRDAPLPRRRSVITTLLQASWLVVFPRLRPSATAATLHKHPRAPDQTKRPARDG